jgi:hypothetical protein
MKRPLLIVVIVLLLVNIACTINLSIPTMEVGDIKTFTVNEPVPTGVSLAEVNLNMGAGTLDLSGGAEGLVNGTITYNVPKWDPVLTSNENGVTLTQGEETDITGFPSSNLVNDWVLKLNETEPIDLTIKAGAYKGTMALGGLHLRNLSVTDGASQVKVSFDEANPEKMDTLTYHTGASQVDFTGLANANFSNMDFLGGAGSYTFDFTGTLLQDTQVSIKTGISSITILVPANMIVIFINSGGVSNISTSGTWTVNGQTYTTGESGYTLTIRAETAVSTIKLVRS